MKGDGRGVSEGEEVVKREVGELEQVMWGSWCVWMRSEVGVEGDCGGTEKGVGGEWKSSRGGEVGG